MDRKTGIPHLHCPNCGEEEIEYESEGDYYICRDCGLEFRLYVIRHGSK